MATAPPPRNQGDFDVAVICALAIEAECVIDVLDNIWKDRKYQLASNDGNAYTLGSIGEHNVVVVHMPGMGTDRAAFAAANLKSSFQNIKLALVAGVCGGMPYNSQKEEIHLGDVVISEALVRYDFGRQYPNGFERRTDLNDILGAPTEMIRGRLAKLKTRQHRQEMQDKVAMFLRVVQQKSSKAEYPGLENDVLYHSTYAHKHRLSTRCHDCGIGNDICKAAAKAECEDLGCDSTMHMVRSRQAHLSTTLPKIHVGIMGSGNTVLKSGEHRDTLAEREDIIAVEMEGAGAWKYGPTIVIKGVCDYADSHKRKGWQQYAAATAAACTKAFLMDWAPVNTTRKPVSTVTSNEYFVVPNRRVKNFFGREEELRKIASYFDDVSDEPRFLVLHAMGGQGKSQIALRYCYTSRSTYKGVFWVNGSSAFTTTQSLAGIAQQIDRAATAMLPDDKAKAKFALRTIEEWDDRWLMVFDNCDDAAYFSELQDAFLPQAGNGCVLITSRHRDLEELGDIIEVPPMPQNPGVRLLLQRYRDVNIYDHLAEATKIVNRLGNLALAIDQASAYMQYTRLPIEKLNTFLPGYLSRREKVLQHTTQNFWKYTRIDSTNDREIAINAFTTWEMSFRQFQESGLEENHVAHFLTLSAFLGLTPIHESLFSIHFETCDSLLSWMTVFTVPSDNATEDSVVSSGEKLTDTSDQMTMDLVRLDQHDDVDEVNEPEITWDADRYWRLVYQAFQMSLLQSVTPAIKSEGASFLLHPLIRDWLQLRLDVSERQLYTREAADVIMSSIIWYHTRHSNAEIKSIILLHIDAVLACDSEFFDDNYRIGHDISTCDRAGWFALFYGNRGQYSTSLKLRTLELETKKATYGTEHPSVLSCTRSLALMQSHLGRYEEAEQTLRQVIEVSKRVLGEEHLDTLTGMNDLALVLGHLGKYQEAESIHRHVVDLRVAVLRKDHPYTLISMNNLALVLSDLGQYEEAVPIHRQVLAVRKEELGMEHPDTLLTMSNLASVLDDLGEYDEAEQMCREVVETRKVVLGKDHPDTLTSMNNLASILDNINNYEEAESIYNQVVEASGFVLGKEHPFTLTVISNLASVLSAQGDFTEAERMHRQVLKSRQPMLGKDHPDTLLSLKNIASALSRQNRFEEAVDFEVQAFEGFAVTLGMEHPYTKESLDDLVYIWECLGRNQDEISSMSEEMYKRLGISPP